MVREASARCPYAGLLKATRSYRRGVIAFGASFPLFAGCGSLNSVPSTQYCRLEPKPLGLALAGAVYYESDIKPLLAANCLSCHSGANPPTFNTYQLAKVEIGNLIDSVKAGRMPKAPVPPLKAEQLALLEAWKAGGMLQALAKPADPVPSGPAASSAPSASSSPAASSTPGSAVGVDTDKNLIKCGSDLEVLDLRKSASNPLLKRDQVAVCQRQGLIYDRNAKVCGPAKLTKDFSCSRSGIAEAFSGRSPGILRLLNIALGRPGVKDDYGEFYSVDQCGKFDNGDPYAFLVRLVRVNQNEELQVIEIKVSGSQ